MAKNRHSDEEPFVFASQVPRRMNYRNAKGERVGMPPSTIPEDDLEEFSFVVTAGQGQSMEPEGPLSGFGQHFMREGKITEQEIYGQPQRKRAEYSVPLNVAVTDRADDGTPGRGVPLEDEYGYEEEVGVRRAAVARKKALMRKQLSYLISQTEQCLRHAQIAENAGKISTARLFDAKAQKFAAQAEKMDRQIALHADYEARTYGT